ncbi:6064_t:CDS:2 [Funneliformis mosseae]|uniref:6064_t:CDS:1 n=1 Tax=Funneliformis mosseae TaxID=27381 RepID=A0A9N8W550_FUNMO|nr:6064_t:CDS:2 [Funneliformis mosseae]
MASVEVKYGQISLKLQFLYLKRIQDYTQFLSNQESFGGNVKFNVYTADYPDNNSWDAEERRNLPPPQLMRIPVSKKMIIFLMNLVSVKMKIMEPSVSKDNNYERQEELLIPVFPANEQNHGFVALIITDQEWISSMVL